MTQQEAYLQCRCGACTIALVNPTMRARTECFCSDCRQRGLISAAANPNNALPKAVADFERGVDLVYFANALIVDEPSEELLEFSKLTADGANTTAMSSCCGTLMCGTHPLYQGTTISVNADSCRVVTSTDISTEIVVFAGDAPDEKAALLEDARSIPVIFNVFDSLEEPVVQTFISAVSRPISSDAAVAETTNFEALCAKKSVTINSAFHD